MIYLPAFMALLLIHSKIIGARSLPFWRCWEHTALLFVSGVGLKKSTGLEVSILPPLQPAVVLKMHISLCTPNGSGSMRCCSGHAFQTGS